MKKSLLYLILFVAANMVGGAVALLLSRWEHFAEGTEVSMDGLGNLPVSIGVAMFCTYVVLVVLMWVLKLIPRPLFPRTDKSPWHAEVSAMAAVAFLAVALSLLIAPLHLSDGGMTEQFDAMKDNVLCLLLLTVVGPLVEELVFRAGVLRSLLQSRWHPLASILTTAALFAVVHANPMQALPALVSGSLFGVLYYRSGSLRLPLMAHILNNTLAVLSMHFPEMESHLEAWPVLWQLLLGFALLCVSFFLVAQWWKKTPQRMVKQ